MVASATIYALSSGTGRAGVAVVRVSGAEATRVLAEMARVVPTPRMARRATLFNPVDGDRLDDGLVIFFPGPRSFTGEDVVELHVHGGRASVEAVLGALGHLEGFRLAEPGEFTRRAFESGKLDLTKAEALADLIDAETDAQRRQALRHMEGGLHRVAESWRATLVEALALIEAAIDFSDEGDVSAKAAEQARAVAIKAGAEMAAALDDQHRGEIVRSGFRVVIAGPPNAGKSSLINALARREAAIVSAEPGTTRDVVELQLNLGGLAVVVADTAGVREATGAVEKEGIRRGLERAQAAELVLWLVDATAPVIEPAAGIGAGGALLRVISKADLASAATIEAIGRSIGVGRWMALSTRTGDGMSALEARIAALAAERTDGGAGSLIANARQRERIGDAVEALTAFAQGDLEVLELRAEDLRRAVHAIGRLVGRVDAEEILGAIFGRFCIGK